MELRTVYVTVGTTKFDRLIQAVTSDRVLRTLTSRGCSKLILQYGKGQRVDANRIRQDYGIEVELYEFKTEGAEEDIARADLIIGHAGAGTCMDILNNKKHGLVVINTELMNNHQTELAEQLAQEKYIYYCTIDELPEQLETLNLSALNSYIDDGKAMKEFVKYLNQMVTN